MNQSPTDHSAAAAKLLPGQNRLAIILYLMVALLYWVSLFLYIPTLATYALGKTQSLAIVGVVLSMYGLWQALIRVPLGITADRLGWRKPFVAAGLALAGLGAWLLGTANGATGLIIGRAMTGLAAGAWVPFIVLFNSLFPAKETIRATTLLTLSNSIGRVLATSVTGSLNDLGGYTLAFWLATGAAGLAMVLLLPIPEKRRPTQLFSKNSLARLATRPDVLLPTLLAALLQYVNWTATLSFIPILVKQLGGTDVTQSLYVSVNIGLVVIGNLAAVTIINHLGIRRLIYLGFITLSTGLGIAALAPSLLMLFGGQILLGLAEGVLYPTLMGSSIRYVADPERNTAMGWHQAVYATGTFAGPWLSGLLADSIGLRSMFGVTALACLVVSLFITSRLVELN
jgi:MFS family permease